MNLGTLIKMTAFQAESIEAPGQWTRSDYLKAIRKACVRAATLLGCTTLVVQRPVLAGANTFSFTAAPLETRSVRNPAMSTVLRKTTDEVENGMDPGWNYKTGVPTRWIQKSGNTILLNRILAEDTTFDVEILETPVALVNDTDPVDPRIPEDAQNGLCYAAAFFLLTQAGDHQDFQKAAACMQQFKDQLGVTNG